jgi:hypothetical protein
MSATSSARLSGRRARAGTAATTALLVALGLGLAGCGGDDSTTVTVDDGTVTVDQDDNRIEIESSDGTATITGETDELPEGWPAQVSIPEGGTITSGVALTGEDQQGWTVSVSYPDTAPTELTAEVKASLADAGFEAAGEFTSDQGSMAAFEGAGLAITALVGEEGAGSTLVMTVANEG